MKRTLLSLTVVLVALTVFFAACDNPTSYTVTNREDLPELSGPEWVKAESYAGANVITWAFVKDASSYTVYRQPVDEDGNVVSGTPFTLVKTSPGQTGTNETFTVVDAVSLTNQLENGVSYLYAVTANNTAGIAGRAAVGSFVKDGVTYADEPVTANIPARGTPAIDLTDPKLTAENITAEGVQLPNSDELLLS
jgi:hypothetical protein